MVPSLVRSSVGIDVAEFFESRDGANNPAFLADRFARLSTQSQLSWFPTSPFLDSFLLADGWPRVPLPLRRLAFSAAVHTLTNPEVRT
jgi:hypothetical protein